MRFFWKLLALVAGLTVTVLAVSAGTFLLTANGHLLDGVGAEAIRLAEGAAAQLSSERVAAVLNSPEDTLEWRRLVNDLTELQAEHGLAGVENVYLIASVDGVLRVLADPTGDDPPLAVADTVLVDLKRSVLRTRTPGRSLEAYADEYGTWMSGYVPVSNAGTDLPVLLGIDLPLGALPVMGDIVTRALLLSLMPALILALVAAVFFSGRLTRPVTRLTEAMGRVRAGDFSAGVEVTSSDEIGAMSRTFNDLVGELEEKVRLRSILDRSFSAQVAEKLLSEGLNLSGEVREVSALFADIRGFTSVVEGMSAKAVVQMLNEYFGALIPCVQRHGGVVDKLIGDEVFAVFGAPTDLANDAMAAVSAALEMRVELEGVNRLRVARGDAPISFGVGINSGSAVAGGLGTDSHLEYTVVGNTINVAARLCSHAGPDQIIVSQGTYLRVKNRCETKALAPVSVKGVTFPLEVFEVVSLGPA